MRVRTKRLDEEDAVASVARIVPEDAEEAAEGELAGDAPPTPAGD